MTNRQENLKELKIQVAKIYSSHSSIYWREGELYFKPNNRYNQHVVIALTDEQVLELGRGTRDNLALSYQNITALVEDYDYLKKQEEETVKEAPEGT